MSGKAAGFFADFEIYCDWNDLLIKGFMGKIARLQGCKRIIIHINIKLHEYLLGPGSQIVGSGFPIANRKMI
jgi:hypothetical protein